MEPELRPRQDFTEFLQGSVTARQRDERVRQVSHKRFALVHRSHDAQFAYTAMRQLAIDQRLRNYSNNLPSPCERAVRQYAH